MNPSQPYMSQAYAAALASGFDPNALPPATFSSAAPQQQQFGFTFPQFSAGGAAGASASNNNSGSPPPPMMHPQQQHLHQLNMQQAALSTLSFFFFFCFIKLYSPWKAYIALSPFFLSLSRFFTRNSDGAASSSSTAIPARPLVCILGQKVSQASSNCARKKMLSLTLTSQSSIQGGPKSGTQCDRARSA